VLRLKKERSNRIKGHVSHDRRAIFDGREEIPKEMPHRSSRHVHDHVSGNARDFFSGRFVCDHVRVIEQRNSCDDVREDEGLRGRVESHHQSMGMPRRPPVAVPKKIVPSGPAAEWSAAIGMEAKNTTMADAVLVPSMVMPNVTSIVLVVICDQRAKKTRDAISIRGRSDQLPASKRVTPPRSAEI
jgi:hypothetical protein